MSSRKLLLFLYKKSIKNCAIYIYKQIALVYNGGKKCNEMYNNVKKWVILICFLVNIGIALMQKED